MYVSGKESAAAKFCKENQIAVEQAIAATLSAKVAIAWNTLSATFHKAKEKSY